MYKKKQFKKSEAHYRKYQHAGMTGKAMDYCHKDLEKYFLLNNKFPKVLEIGAGTSPHINYIEHKYDKYYSLETSKFAIKFLKKKFKKKKIYPIYYNGSKIPFKKKFFDRIIISHVLEHINDPEKFILQAFSKLKKNGILSISLPTDPGLLWRIGRNYIKLSKGYKLLKIADHEYEYMNATEHINSIFNLVAIIDYHFKDFIVSKNYWPFKIEIADLNLFYNVNIKKIN
tara:strand:+ start:2000 stop:2686 length:687 start_codon:yes stop_codon:yes gene_type:complete